VFDEHITREEKPLVVARSHGGRSCRKLWSKFTVEETVAKKPGKRREYRDLTRVLSTEGMAGLAGFCYFLIAERWWKLLAAG